MTKADNTEDKKDESKEKEEVLDLTLDQVHENTIADLEKEGEDDSAEDDKDSGDKDAGADKDEADGDDKPADKGDPDKGTGQDGDDAGKADETDDDKTPAPTTPEPAPELDTDSTKAGEGKIAVKDFDDKVHYFNNLEEVPEDFEPKSYKEWGRFVQKATDKEQSDRTAAAEAEVQAEKAERNARLKSIKDDWDKDIKMLTDNKSLPEDVKERQPVIDAVFDVMNEKLARGKVIDFETGYEIYSSKQSKDGDKEKIDKANADKKKRGGMVASAGSGASARPKVIEGPPPGVTLDQVHESVLNSL